MTFRHRSQKYHLPPRFATRQPGPTSRALPGAVVAVLVVLLVVAVVAALGGCATGSSGRTLGPAVGYDAARATQYGVSPDKPAGGVQGFTAARRSEAEITLQCLLPTALAYPETIRAPVAELHAFMQSIAVAAGPARPRADLVAEVERGRRPVANVAWWDPDPSDATAALQAAIDSGAQAVFVPSSGSPWQIRPIKLRGDLVLVFDEGVELVAKRGAFLERNATMFSVADASRILIWGYGATLRMRKTDYSSWPYAESEYRHALRFRSVTDLGVYGLRVEDAGGDGIYIGRSRDGRAYSENVVIRDVVLESGNRQGLSVVSARRVLIEHSTFSNTKGTLPQAGIDFEPNKPDEYLEDIVVRESLFFRNRGAGIQFFLWNMTEDSPPISVRIESSELRGNLVDFYVARAGGTPTGRIEVVDSRIGWRRWVSMPPGLEVDYE